MSYTLHVVPGPGLRPMPYPARIDASALGRTALAAVEELGWESWTLRDVADRLGVSVNALYGHVDSRDHLAALAAAAATHELLEALVGERIDGDPGDASLGWAVDDPIDRVVRLAERYMRFAVERPEAYAAFVRGKPASTDPGRAVWNLVWSRVLEIVADAVPESVDAAGFTLWSMLHGRAELCAAAGSVVDPQRGLADAVRATVTGFAAAGPLPSPLPGRPPYGPTAVADPSPGPDAAGQ